MPKHANEGEFCPSCEEKLNEADPRLRVFMHFIWSHGYRDAHISCSWRGPGEQLQLFRSGFSEKPWPDSKHNHMKDGKPFSLAVDLFQLMDDGEARFQASYYGRIYAMVKENKAMRIRWGGDFKDEWIGGDVDDYLAHLAHDKAEGLKHFFDGPHFELREAA